VSRRVRGAWIRALREAMHASFAVADQAKTLATAGRAVESRRIFHAALRTTTLIGRA
jgi:hypothetical protein